MKILTVYAHPADTITNCGGTLARHADAGDDITALIVTHGGRIHANRYAEEWRKNAPDETIATAGVDEIIEHKKGELERAAEIVGIRKLITLDHDDNLAAVREDAVDQIAETIALEAPDVILCDYPKNPVFATDTHTVISTMALAAVARAGMFLKNLDGRSETWVKQVFMTSLQATGNDALSYYGLRNDYFVDITPVVDRKIAAMDCFDSQGYSGLFARKLIEANNGELGRAAGVNFAEAFVRLNSETHPLLTITDAAREADPLTRHVTYSQIDLRAQFPMRVGE
jgi:LmbE family N-acetylglucosaminyl deacetylase